MGIFKNPSVFSSNLKWGDLHQRISYACQTIINGPGTFESVRQSTRRCVHACNDSGGGYFENMLLSLALQKILTPQLLHWECAL